MKWNSVRFKNHYIPRLNWPAGAALEKYMPKWWVDLSFNSRVILEYIFFLRSKLEIRPKNLGLNLSSMYLLIWPSRLLYSWDCSQFWSKFKTRKSPGLPLSYNSSQLSTWAHKCHFRFESLSIEMKFEQCFFHVRFKNHYIPRLNWPAGAALDRKIIHLNFWT